MQKPITPTGTDFLRRRETGHPRLYLQIAGELERQIRTGTLVVGEKVPSIRALRKEWQVSTSTALQTYFCLENRGLIEARPRSGFYVRVPFSDLAPEPNSEAQRSPRDAGLDTRLGKLLQLRPACGALRLGADVPSSDFYPVRRLNHTIRQIIRRNPTHSCGYQFPHGLTELRRQIAKHAFRQIGKSSWEQITVTVGAMEGLTLSLRAVAKAGDVVAVESPTFFGILQLVQSLGMQAFEISTDPRSGMDLNLLEHALRRKRVRACIIISNCHNPLGYVLSDSTKSNLAELSKRYKVPIIEDDLFGDIAFEEPRPRTIKHYDCEGYVLLVSSFCRVLGPGYRIGWVHAGRWQSTVEKLQFTNTVAAPSLPQHVIAAFLESGGYERHLRRVRVLLADRLHMASRALARYFPSGTRVSRPGGGYLLWVQLPQSVDANAVFEKALQQKIGIVVGPIFSTTDQCSIVPGTMYSTTGQYSNCFRLSCGMPWSQRLEESLATLGSIVGRLVDRKGSSQRLAAGRR